MEKTGKLFVRSIPRLITARSTDTILVKCDRFYQRFLHKKGMLVFPTMVDMVLDTSKDLGHIFSRNTLTYSAFSILKKLGK